MIARPKVNDCRTCGGSGVLPRPLASWESPRVGDDTIPCPDCHGVPDLPRSRPSPSGDLAGIEKLIDDFDLACFEIGKDAEAGRATLAQPRKHRAALLSAIASLEARAQRAEEVLEGERAVMLATVRRAEAAERALAEAREEAAKVADGWARHVATKIAEDIRSLASRAPDSGGTER